MAVTPPVAGKKEIPHGVWTTCKKCQHIIFTKKLEENLNVCTACGYNFRLSAQERIALLLEPESFIEHDADMSPVDSLGFPEYAARMTKSKMKDAVVSGEGKIGKYTVMIAVQDFSFMGGSMGSVVGEKIANAAELAIKKKCPLIIVSSSGGARMQEGILSLMQMAKTSAALSQLAHAKLPFISILTDPTTGGVTASFAMLGDVNITEPGALIGFAGPRVIEQTIRQKLPKGFQMSQFVLDHGMVDIIVERKDMKETLIKLLSFFMDK